MSALLANVVSVIAGIGSLVCFILVVIHLFQTDQKGLGIAALFLCLSVALAG